MEHLQVIAQQGASVYLIRVPRGPFQGMQDVDRGVVYDRDRGTVTGPFAVGSIAARGYWDTPVLTPTQESQIISEVKEVMNATPTPART